MKCMAVVALALGISNLAVASEAGNGQGLTAPQIVEKNAAARGGLEAWRKIQSMAWVGHVDSSNAPQPNLPFALEMKRPNRTRFEIKAQNQTSVRMFDGAHGWKLRQVNLGKPEVQPYTPDELRFAQEGQGLDGPLMDYQAKGIAVALEGMDEVEGRRAYRLSVKLPSGNSHHIWVDAQTFLEVKYDRLARSKFGQAGTVSVFYRDYRTVEGLQIPFMIESKADKAAATDKMVIEKVLLNPPLEDAVFAYSGSHGRGKMAGAGTGPRSARNLPMGNPGPAKHGLATPRMNLP